MTTERQEGSTPPAPDPYSEEAFIADATQVVEETTSDEQVAEADAATQMEPIPDVPALVGEEQPVPTPEPEAVAAEPSVAEPETPVTEEPAQPAEPETQPEPETPQPRVHSEEDWNTREASYRRNQSELQNRLAALEQTSAAAQVDQYVELAAQQSEAQLTPTLGAEEARRQARDPATLERMKRGLLAASENVQLRQQLVQAGTQNEAQAKVSTVQHFATLHNVSETDRPLLESAGTPEQMETLAKRLGTPVTEVAAEKPAATVEPKVPAGSAERMETGESEAPALDDDAREAAINEKHPSEWTEVERSFQARRYV